MSTGESLVDMALPASFSEKEIRGIIAEIKKLQTPGFQVSLPGDWGGIQTGRKQGVGILTCQELWERPYVTVDGRVTPCCFIGSPAILDMGDFNTQTFEEIWFGPVYEQLRQQHLTNHHPEICAKCQALIYTFVEPSWLLGRRTASHLRIPSESATYSEGARPGITRARGHVLRDLAAG